MARAKSNKGSRTGDATDTRRATAPKQRRAGSRGEPAATTTAPKQTYHHGALKEGLVAAGEAVLADRGLQGFTLRECARRAGVSHAAPKHHFGDVRGLLTEIAARGFAQLTRRLRSKIRTAGDDLDAQFIATVDAYLGFAEAYPEHFRIMFRSDLVDVHAPRSDPRGTTDVHRAHQRDPPATPRTGGGHRTRSICRRCRYPSSTTSCSDGATCMVSPI